MCLAAGVIIHDAKSSDWPPLKATFHVKVSCEEIKFCYCYQQKKTLHSGGFANISGNRNLFSDAWECREHDTVSSEPTKSTVSFHCQLLCHTQENTAGWTAAVESYDYKGEALVGGNFGRQVWLGSLVFRTPLSDGSWTLPAEGRALRN